jgi:hypothetical protein
MRGAWFEGLRTPLQHAHTRIEACDFRSALDVLGTVELRIFLFALFAVTTCSRLEAREASHVFFFHGQDPDHLEPVNPHQPWRARYFEAIRSRFNLDDYYYLQMLMMPSFAAESAVCLRSEHDSPIEKADKFFLTYTVAAENIYYATQIPNPKTKPEDVAVMVTTVEFPKTLALRLDKLWSRMLLRTRYSPLRASLITDGAYVEFGRDKAGLGSYYGEAYFPTTDGKRLQNFYLTDDPGPETPITIGPGQTRQGEYQLDQQFDPRAIPKDRDTILLWAYALFDTRTPNRSKFLPACTGVLVLPKSQ